MNNLNREIAWTVRESDDGEAELAGIAVPWDEPTDVGGYRESFARGAFDPEQVVGRPLFWRHGEVIGRITRATDADAGLAIEATILPTSLGRDAAVLMRGDAVAGLSVGFEPLEHDTVAGVVTRTKARLLELSLTPAPAYAGATITAHREDTPMPDQTPEVAELDTTATVDVEAREAIQTVAADVAALRTARVEVREEHPLAPFPSFGHYLQAIAAAKTGGDHERREILTRALDVATTGTNPGTVPPAWVGDIARQINHGRPTVTTIGRRELPSTGMTVIYRAVSQSTTIGEQLTEATEVSSQALTIDYGEAAVHTYAGAVRVSMQEIQRSDPSYLSELQIDMATSWAKTTNTVAVATLNQGTGTGSFAATLDTGNVGATLGAAAADIATAGGTLRAVILDPSLFFAIATVAGQGYPYAGGNVASADLTGVSYTAFGVRFVLDPSITGGYALDTDAVRFWEAGPFGMSADEPGVLSRDIALFSYNAHAAVRPAQIVKLNQASTRTATK
jgi:HK97 family phage prohead protease